MVAEEVQPTLIDEIRMGQGARNLGTGDIRQICSRDEIEDYAIRPLRGAAGSPVLDEMHREPLMVQRFSQSRVDMSTKTGNRGFRRSLQHQWDEPGNHSGHRLCLRTDPPAYRKIENHLRTLDVAPPHQQRTCRGNHRRTTHPQRLRQLSDSGDSNRVQFHRYRRLVGFTAVRGGRQPIRRFAFGRQVLSPIGLIVEIIGGRFVFRLASDQITQRSEKSGGNRCARRHGIVDIADPMTNKSEADSVRHYMVAADEQIKFICPRLQQREFEQRPAERHHRALNRGCQPIGFLDRILRAHPLIASKLDIRVINRRLEHLAIHLEKGGSKWFGLAHHLTDRVLQQPRVDRALDSQKIAQLPPRTSAIRFLRKPYIELPARQREWPTVRFRQSLAPNRQRPVIDRHRIPFAVYLSEAWRAAASLFRSVFGRISGQFCSMYSRHSARSASP
ncbi:hypothetical protein MOTT12_02208 [Mycobacterium intracellulare subsp. yongonense]|nr:hypothetical protein MOTT12_02208 [Mycobacterium intracellulare subsp. yongonense]ARR82969.1 hypothetical protein MOTT27_02148 [Mycobacterium intracellulare subsp. yongonense]